MQIQYVIALWSAITYSFIYLFSVQISNQHLQKPTITKYQILYLYLYLLRWIFDKVSTKLFYWK